MLLLQKSRFELTQNVFKIYQISRSSSSPNFFKVINAWLVQDRREEDLYKNFSEELFNREMEEQAKNMALRADYKNGRSARELQRSSFKAASVAFSCLPAPQNNVARTNVWENSMNQNPNPDGPFFEENQADSSLKQSDLVQKKRKRSLKRRTTSKKSNNVPNVPSQEPASIELGNNKKETKKRKNMKNKTIN